jgi:hypothetical protein
MQRVYVFFLKVKRAIFREYRYSPPFRQFVWSMAASLLALIRLFFNNLR